MRAWRRQAAADAGRSTVAAVKPSIVGIGTLLQTRSPAIVFSGTGFVVGDGLSVITNAHVVPDELDGARLEKLGIVVRTAPDVRFRAARLVGTRPSARSGPPAHRRARRCRR